MDLLDGPSRRQRRRRRQKTSLKKLILFLTAGAVLLAAAVPATILVRMWQDTPSLEDLESPHVARSSKIYSSDGVLLGYIRADVVREVVKQDEIPAWMKRATVAIEDKRFYQHEGFDVWGIARAALKNLEAGEVLQGGSTITQQLIRNAYISDPEDTIQRKLDEAKLAYELEKEYSKAGILTRYLNIAPYGTLDGRTAVGVEAAAQMFFSKPAEKLSLIEAALLAGLPQSPSRYNPISHPRAAKSRRRQVLMAMADMNQISSERAKELSQATLKLDPSDVFVDKKEPLIFDFVEQELIERYGIATVKGGGLEVTTTINPKMQAQALDAINGQLNLPEDPDSAVVTIDPQNGAILALASSTPYEELQYNLAAQGKRQAGSAFKTFVLAAAVRAGIDPSSTYYTSQPLNLNLPEYGPWEVSTYDGSYLGSTSVSQATLSSDNSVYAQLALDVGPEYVAETAKDLGVKTQLDGLPAEALGGLRLGVSPLEMASAYATLAAGGVRHRPTAISEVKFPGGRVEKPISTGDGERVMTDGEASVITQILEDNVQSGTGTAASIGCPVAGKTGTTDDFKDAWFVGYTPLLATSVWVGHAAQPQPMTSVHGISVAGGTFPAQIWHDYMQSATGSSCEDFAPPEEPASLSALSAGFAAGDFTGYPVVEP